jgi:hypothetical protein
MSMAEGLLEDEEKKEDAESWIYLYNLCGTLWFTVFILQGLGYKAKGLLEDEVKKEDAES